MPTPLDVLAAAVAKAQAEYDAAKAAIAAQVAAPAPDASPTDVIAGIVHQVFDLGIAAATAVQAARKPTSATAPAAIQHARVATAAAVDPNAPAKTDEGK
jgi:hypothetical protein